VRVRAAGGRYVLVEGRGMTIRNITQEDDGEYICRAEVNADGRYNEKKITVKVHSEWHLTIHKFTLPFLLIYPQQLTKHDVPSLHVGPWLWCFVEPAHSGFMTCNNHRECICFYVIIVYHCFYCMSLVFLNSEINK